LRKHGRKYLTDRAVSAAKSDPAQRLEIADAGLPGLYLVVQPSGSKSWALRYRHAGRPRKATLGSCPPVGLADARKRAKDAIDAIEQGRDPASERIAAKRRQHVPGLDADAFGVQVRLYLTRHAVPHTRSWRETARNLGLRPDPDTPGAFVDIPGGLADRWAARPVQAITRRQVIEAIDEAVDRGAPVAANRLLGILARFFNWLRSRDVLATVPTDGVKRPTVETTRDRVLSDGELVTVWRAAEAIRYPMGPVVMLLLLTGQRRDEVAAATWDEIDLEAAVWRLPAARTKNARPHVVQLSNAALGVLADVPRFEGGPYLFGKAGRGPFSGFSRAKARLAELAGIDPFTLHDFRRTCATGLAGLGVPPHVVERILNHVSGTRGSVAGIYDRAALDTERRDALARWARHVEGLLNDAAPNVVELRRGV
jgi:integrase